VRRAMPELSGFGKYVRFVHTENLIHNPDQQMSYSVKGANRPAVSGPRHPQMRVVRAVPGPVEGHHDFGRKHSDGKPGHRPSNAIQHVCELEGTRGIVVEAGSVDSHAGRPRALLQVAKTMGQAELWFGAGRRAQGAGRRAQGAGRRAQGAGRGRLPDRLRCGREHYRERSGAARLHRQRGASGGTPPSWWAAAPAGAGRSGAWRLM
jgi:hypothetical protein